MSHSPDPSARSADPSPLSPEAPSPRRVRRHYRIALSLVIAAAAALIVTVMSLNRLPLLDGVVGAGGGIGCLGPRITCDPGRTATTHPSTTPASTTDPR
jgi:hypothetical protein